MAPTGGRRSVLAPVRQSAHGACGGAEERRLDCELPRERIGPAHCCGAHAVNGSLQPFAAELRRWRANYSAGPRTRSSGFAVEPGRRTAEPAH
eukprot:13350285-Alexandrium_andersonii.AAC.1